MICCLPAVVESRFIRDEAATLIRIGQALRAMRDTSSLLTSASDLQTQSGKPIWKNESRASLEARLSQ